VDAFHGDAKLPTFHAKHRVCDQFKEVRSSLGKDLKPCFRNSVGIGVRVSSEDSLHHIYEVSADLAHPQPIGVGSDARNLDP
jgi:hypothetical protein